MTKWLEGEAHTFFSPSKTNKHNFSDAKLATFKMLLQFTFNLIITALKM